MPRCGSVLTVTAKLIFCLGSLTLKKKKDSAYFPDPRLIEKYLFKILAMWMFRIVEIFFLCFLFKYILK